MRLYMKVGTMSANYYEVRGDYYKYGSERIPPKLKEAPKVGAMISWQEILNGKWQSGKIDDHDEELDLYFVERM